MNVSIYIENYKLDTNEDTIVALTMCYSYVEDPTTIAGDYSKSITVPGTVNNNMIFGQFWNIDRRFLESDDDSNSGVYFNASKRTPAKIYLGNDIFKSGYVQLNAVNKTQGKITYEITFYSELCNMLHTIMDSSLSALKFPGSLAHTINTNAIVNNLNNNGPKILNSNSNLSDFVYYGLSLDGVLDNFNASKWLTYDTANKKYVVADIDSNGTSYDAAMILQEPSNRVRPYIKISSLLNQIKDDYNDANDTKLEFNDPYFFNSSNPYVSNTVFSGKVYSSDNTSTSFSEIHFDDFEVVGGLANAKVIRAKDSELVDSDGNIDLSNFSVIPRIELECMLAIDGSLNGNDYSAAINGAVYNTGRQFTTSGAFIPYFTLQKLDSSGNVETNYVLSMSPTYPNQNEEISCSQIKDSHNTVISPLIFESNSGNANFELAFKNCVYNRTDTIMDCSQTPCVYRETLLYDKRYTNLNTGGMDSEIVNYYTDNNDGIGVTDFFPFKFYRGSIPPGKYRLRFHCSSKNVIWRIRDCADYPFGDSTKDIAMTSFRVRGRFSTKVGTNSKQLRNVMLYRNYQPLQVYLANNLEDTTVTNTTGQDLSMTSSSGTSTGSTVSFADMIDADTTQGQFLVNYTKLFGLVYDSDSVNNDKTIKIKTRDYYHQDYKILDWTDKIDYSQTFKHDPLSFNTRYLSLNYNPSESYYAKKYANTFDTSYGVQLIDTGYEFNTDTSTLINDQIMNQAIMVKGESRFSGVCPAFFDKSDNSRSPIDGHYSLLFWNADKSDCYKQQLYIFDDNEAMHDASNGGEETMCYVDTDSLTKYGGMVQVGQYLKIPAPNSLRDSFSTDLGYPRANFANWNISDYSSSGTIFNQFWNTYIKDLYNANTQIITAYVHLSPLEIMNFSFKNFVKIKDTLWHPNKIEDYNPLSTKPVSVELVKVNDINSYTNAQMKFYEYFRAEFNVYTNDSTVPADKILTPVSGGVITGSSTNQYYGNFRYGTKWSQGFTTVGVYTKVSSVEAFYYTSDGVKVDCSNWLDVNTLTFTCQEIPTSDVTVNLQMQENEIYYNVGVELDNAKVTWVNPSTQVTRIKAGSVLKLTFDRADDLDESYQFSYATVSMGVLDISETVVDTDSKTIDIESVSGDVIINIAYAQYEDVVLPWIGSGSSTSNIPVTTLPYFLVTSTSSNPNYVSGFKVGAYCYDTNYYTQANVHPYSVIKAGKVGYSTNMGLFLDKRKITDAYGNPTGETADKLKFTYPVKYDTTIDDKDHIETNKNLSKTNKYQFDILFDKGNYLQFIYSVSSINTLLAVNNNPNGFTRQSYDLTTTDDSKIKLFAQGVGVYNDTGVYANGNYIRVTSLELWNSSLNKIYRYIPMMHYFNDKYRPCLYEIYSGTYVLPDNSSLNYTYDSNSQEDIPIKWIASDGNCCFNVGNFHERETTPFGIDINCSFTDFNNDKYLFSTDQERIEYSTSDYEIHGNCVNYLKINKLNGSRTGSFGMYLENNGSGVPTLESNVIEHSSTQISVNNPTHITMRPYRNPYNTNNYTYHLVTNDKAASGENNNVAAVGTSPIYLFKEYTGNSIATYSQGVHVFDVRLYDTNADSSSLVTKRYLIPVLHFTGSKIQYISNEGIKIPIGYSPCFYDTVNNTYIYSSGAGTPLFGFKI